MTDKSRRDDGTEFGVSAPAALSYEMDPDERPSRAVVRAVASVTNTPVLDLDPLYDVVDPDHLDGVCSRTGQHSAMTASSISFLFNGCEVTVEDDVVCVREELKDRQR